MEKQHLVHQVELTINPNMCFITETQLLLLLINGMKTAKYVLLYAETLYWNFVQGRHWTQCLQKPDSQQLVVMIYPVTSHIQMIQRSNNAPTLEIASTVDLQISTSRSVHIMGRGSYLLKQKQTSNHVRLYSRKEPQVASSWTIKENNCQVINRKLHVFDPQIGRSGRWIEDTTPPDGQSNDVKPPSIHIGCSISPNVSAMLVKDNNSTLTLQNPWSARFKFTCRLLLCRQRWSA